MGNIRSVKARIRRLEKAMESTRQIPARNKAVQAYDRYKPADRFSDIFSKSGLSQTDMARSLGITQSMVSKILNHKASPSKTVMILAEILYAEPNKEVNR
ncbi:MAG: helix-turn-helix transcriptional regulator [Oscillospiraceae bacterium]|nr:helix-turn-helix transcriptional regulator [Oscillospiraceae bacterium]